MTDTLPDPKPDEALEAKQRLASMLDRYSERFGTLHRDIADDFRAAAADVRSLLSAQQRLDRAMELLRRTLAYMPSTYGTTKDIRDFLASIKGDG